MSDTEQAAAFLAGRGRQVAPSAVRRLGLAADLVDDVTQDALLRVHRAELAGTVIADVDAFTATLVRRAARDLLRGRGRRPEGHVAPLPAEGDGTVEQLAGPVEPDIVVVAAVDAAAVRTGLGARLGDVPHDAAGALAVLAVVVGGAGPADDCPQPRGGAGADDAATWAGLFYAGCRGCFATDDASEDAAMRQRRSRAASRVRRLLAAVATDAGLEAPGHG